MIFHWTIFIDIIILVAEIQSFLEVEYTVLNFLVFLRQQRYYYYYYKYYVSTVRTAIHNYYNPGHFRCQEKQLYLKIVLGFVSAK